MSRRQASSSANSPWKAASNDAPSRPRTAGRSPPASPQEASWRNSLETAGPARSRRSISPCSVTRRPSRGHGLDARTMSSSVVAVRRVTHRKSLKSSSGTEAGTLPGIQPRGSSRLTCGASMSAIVKRKGHQKSTTAPIRACGLTLYSHSRRGSGTGPCANLQPGTRSRVCAIGHPIVKIGVAWPSPFPSRGAARRRSARCSPPRSERSGWRTCAGILSGGGIWMRRS